MEKEKILIVEDDKHWIVDYKRWLQEEPVEIDAAETAAEALDLLKTNYYAVVLLDLSLHPTYSSDRTSEEVQKYLIKKKEGTKHIIISAHADKQDVQLGAFKYRSFDILFKEQFENTVLFLDAVKRAIVQSKKERPDFLKEADDVFIGLENKGINEYRILETIKPENGITGWYSFREKLFESISPIIAHQTRNRIAFVENCILGLFWSRKIGKAISICISSVETPEYQCVNSLNDWLGWAHSEELRIEHKGVRGIFFIEEDLSPDDFVF